MKTFLSLLAGAALTISASAHADTPPTSLSEGFDNVAALSGWSLYNAVLSGNSWFQGNTGIFSAADGAANSYIAANYLSAGLSSSVVDNWLITPEFTLSAQTQLRFFTRNSAEEGFNDTLEVLFSSGGTDPASFTKVLTIGGASLYPGSWSGFTALVGGSGTGRFAFHYTGSVDSASYIGIDTVSIAAVPEPESWLMLGAGLAGLALLRRKGRKAAGAGIALAAMGMGAGAMADELPQQGVVVVRDAETGKLRAPTADEFRKLVPKQLPQVDAKTGAVLRPAREVAVTARGAKVMNVSDKAVFTVVHRNADGSLTDECVTGEQAAMTALNRKAAKEAGYEAQ